MGGHFNAVNALCMVGDKIYTAGRDKQLMGWRGAPTAGGLELVQDGAPVVMPSDIKTMCAEPTSKWLFCGMWRGDIHAFCQDCLEDRLVGHTRFVSSIAVHSGVVISGSNDSTVRLWTPNGGRFQACGQPMNNPSGAVTSVKVVNDSLWVGGQTGITCFDLTTLQAKGTLLAPAPVTGLLEYGGYVIAAFRNGDVKIYDGAGQEGYHHPARGEHNTNYAVEIMEHPVTKKAILLCGQQFGFVTAYDLPDFHPRGSFVARHNSDITAVLDAKVDGMFLTSGFGGDVTIWQWGKGRAGFM